MNPEEITVEEFTALLEARPEFAEAIQTKEPELNEDIVSRYLESDDGKRLIQPIKDSYASKAIEGWKLNNIDRIVSEAVSAATPQETPEQKQLKEVQRRLNESEQERNKERMRNVANQIAEEKGIPAALARLGVGDSESATRNNMNAIQIEFDAAIEKVVNEKLTSTSRQPLNTAGEPASNPISQVDISKMNYDQLMALRKSNPHAYQRAIEG